MAEHMLMDWFINSECDYSCSRCTPHEQKSDRADLDLRSALSVLDSYVELGQVLGRDAHITFYPRQARFKETFLTVLGKTKEYKAIGVLKSVEMANRGDLPDEKIRQYHENGVDSCLLTIDGPEPIQNELRRPNSFKETMNAFRKLRNLGIHVSPLIILVRFNAPYITETIEMLLNEGFDDIRYKAAIKSKQSSSQENKPANPWNDTLTEDEYQKVEIEIQKIIGNDKKNEIDGKMKWIVRPHGDVLYLSNTIVVGSFPDFSFKRFYDKLAAN